MDLHKLQLLLSKILYKPKLLPQIETIHSPVLIFSCYIFTGKLDPMFDDSSSRKDTMMKHEQAINITSDGSLQYLFGNINMFTIKPTCFFKQLLYIYIFLPKGYIVHTVANCYVTKNVANCLVSH